MTLIDTKHLRELAEAAKDRSSAKPRHAVDAFVTDDEEAFDGAVSPETLIALLDEIERLRGDTEWEYGRQYTDEGGNPCKPRLSSLEDLSRPDGHRADGTPYWNFTAVRRRKAGPWEPVEGETDD